MFNHLVCILFDCVLQSSAIYYIFTIFLIYYLCVLGYGCVLQPVVIGAVYRYCIPAILFSYNHFIFIIPNNSLFGGTIGQYLPLLYSIFRLMLFKRFLVYYQCSWFLLVQLETIISTINFLVLRLVSLYFMGVVTEWEGGRL